MKKAPRKDAMFKHAIAEESDSDYDEEGHDETNEDHESHKMESKYDHEYVLAKIKKLQAQTANLKSKVPAAVAGQRPDAFKAGRPGQIQQDDDEDDEGEDEEGEYEDIEEGDEEEEEDQEEDDKDEKDVVQDHRKPPVPRQNQLPQRPATAQARPNHIPAQRAHVNEKENKLPVTSSQSLRPGSSYGKSTKVVDYGLRESQGDLRPKTAIGRGVRYDDGDYGQEYEEPERVVVHEPFRPVYTIAYNEFLIHQKKFNFKEKTFKTIAKKTDRVKRFQEMQNQWSSSKFLSHNNGGKGKEGRKFTVTGTGSQKFVGKV